MNGLSAVVAWMKPLRGENRTAPRRGGFEARPIRGSALLGPGLRGASPGLLLLCAVAAALSTVVETAWTQQPARIPVVGVLVTHAAENDPIFDSLRAGLREYGYQEGRNIKLEIVTAEGQLDRLPGIAQELVRQNVDVIIAPNEVSNRTAQQATNSIPIVSIGFGNDPVASGVVDSFGKPGGNVTGIYGLWVELDGKRLEVLKETLPSVSRVAVFRAVGFDRQLGELQRAAQSLGVRLELMEVGGPNDFERAFKAAKHKKVGAVMLESSPIFYVHRARVAAFALGARLPTISGFDLSVEAGGLMSYGADVAETFRRTAYYVDRLLKGAKPSDLPVEQVSKFKLAVNLKTAKALNITIPESILLRADEVIR